MLNEMYDKGEINKYFIPRHTDPLYQQLLDSNNIKEFKYV
jgi:hypothetical protein